MTETHKSIPDVKGLPFIGNTLSMAKDPAAFFVRCYREYGPVFRINVFGRKTYVIAGSEASKFMSTPAGRNGLRSREFWQDFVDYYGASKALVQADGDEHRQLRAVMREGYSPKAIYGRYHNVVDFIDTSITRDWAVGTRVPVVEAFQYMIVHIIGEIMCGYAPIEYVRDIRTNILFLLNVLVTRQRPKFMLKHRKFKKATKRFDSFGRKLVEEFLEHAEKGTLPKNLLGDIMRAHIDDPDMFQARDLQLLLSGPFVAGLDTVANTLASTIYGILKTPGVVAKVQQEAEALFAKDYITEKDVQSLDYILCCAKEAMRLWPVAVAQMRTTVHELDFEGTKIPAEEMIYIGTSVPHFMEEFFPDPKKFDPTRFNDERQEHTKPGAYTPFGRGPHTCLGRNLAEVLMGVIIARLFYRLDLSLETPNYVLKTKSAPTPGPSTRFAVKVNNIRKQAVPINPEPLGDVA